MLICLFAYQTRLVLVYDPSKEEIIFRGESKLMSYTYGSDGMVCLLNLIIFILLVPAINPSNSDLDTQEELTNGHLPDIL